MALSMTQGAPISALVVGDATLAHSASAGAWIAPRLCGEFGAVTRQVPSGYEAYARICHPASDSHGRQVSWPIVASATGGIAHPLMQWHALVGSPDPINLTGSLWPGGNPARGNLAPDSLEALCNLLGDTGDTAKCFFALWNGWGWLEVDGGTTSRVRAPSRERMAESGERPPVPFTADEFSRARLILPDRSYVLLSGPLAAASQLGNPWGACGFEPQSPNLFWPADRSWLVASEVDFDSTLVGGSAKLIGVILGASGLDVWPVVPNDSLAYYGDRINKVPRTEHEERF